MYNFSDKEWIEIFEIFAARYRKNGFEPWDLIYGNQVGERLGVIFVETLITHVDSAGAVKGEADVLVEYIRKNKDLH